MFLAELARRRLLKRVYTQNIDGLEEAAGIPKDRIVQCHDNAMRTVCSANRNHTVNATMDVHSNSFVAPRCSCGALLRPDIVFFGEPLPADFENNSGQDMHNCDLLIVIGTALNVYPVAGLVNRAQVLTPRLLINREPVGVWRSCEHNEENYRDVMWKGECDDGADKLLQLLEWGINT